MSVGCQPCCPKGGPKKATSESQARGAAQGQDSAVQRTAQQNRWGEEALVLQECSSAPLRFRKMGDRLLCLASGNTSHGMFSGDCRFFLPVLYFYLVKGETMWECSVSFMKEALPFHLAMCFFALLSKLCYTATESIFKS